MDHLLERVAQPEWDRVAPTFRDFSYRQCSSYAHEAAERVGASSELNEILTPERCLLGLAEVRVKRAPLISLGIAYANYAPLVARGDHFSELDFGRCVDALCQEYVGRRGFVLRISPPPYGGLFLDQQLSCLATRGFRAASPKARTTFILDMSVPLEDIRRRVDPKWRASLNKAEKAGIRISRSTNVTDFDRFEELFLECAVRKGFRADHDVSFFRRVQARAAAGQELVLHLAWAGEQLVAGHLGSYVGDTAVYLLGAANFAGRDSCASFLLQWNAISHAANVGNRFYDLGGVDERTNPGVYRFKRRLNGRLTTELGVYELAPGALSRSLFRLAEAIRLAIKSGVVGLANSG